MTAHSRQIISAPEYKANLLFKNDLLLLSLCDVRVSPNNTVKPNLGASELTEAISRVLPFVSQEENRPKFNRY